MKTELIVKTAITKDKAIILGRTVILFGKPRVAVGFLHDAIAFAGSPPRSRSTPGTNSPSRRW